MSGRIIELCATPQSVAEVSAKLQDPARGRPRAHRRPGLRTGTSAPRPPSPKTAAPTNVVNSLKGPSVDYAPSNRNERLDQDRRGRRLRRRQDHLRGCRLRDRPAAHRGPRDQRVGGRGRHLQGAVQDHHDGGDGLRPHHPGAGPRPLPLRHTRPAALLVHVGRPGQGRHRRHRPGRHPPPRRQLRRRGLLRGQGRCRSSSRSTSSTTPSSSAPRRSARPWPSPRTSRSSPWTPATGSRPSRRSCASPSSR